MNELKPSQLRVSIENPGPFLGGGVGEPYHKLLRRPTIFFWEEDFMINKTYSIRLGVVLPPPTLKQLPLSLPERRKMPVKVRYSTEPLITG